MFIVYGITLFLFKQESKMRLLYCTKPPPTLFSLSKTPVITRLPGIVISIPLYIVYLNKTHGGGEKLIFSLGSAPLVLSPFSIFSIFFLWIQVFINLFMFLFSPDPVFTLTPCHLTLPLFCYQPFSTSPMFISFSYLYFIFSGCRICEQRGNGTQTAPGTAGWDLCYEGGLPPSSALHAADGQQCNPRADFSARY